MKRARREVINRNEQYRLLILLICISSMFYAMLNMIDDLPDSVFKTFLEYQRLNYLSLTFLPTIFAFIFGFFLYPTDQQFISHH
jgi:hypothetical protein